MARKNKRDDRWVTYFPEVWDECLPGECKPRFKRNQPKRLVRR